MSTQPSYGSALDEWKEARAVLARFDENLHDLRKYGFSFVTALLAANGLLSQGGDAVIPVGVRAGVLIVTMGLIVTLKLLDTHYRRFQKAASVRGRILEDRLNLNLTEDISFFYKLESWWKYVQALYYGFVALTLMVGFAILWNNPFFILIVFLAAVTSAYLVYFINDEKRSLKFTELCDWSVDMKIVSKGTPVRITYTNLDPKDRLNPDTFMLGWDVKKVSAEKKETSEDNRNLPNAVKADLKYFENYDWLWETNASEPGLYELEMYSTKIEKDTSKDLNQIAKPGEATSTFTIQVTPAGKQEGPIKVVLEKTNNL